MTAKSALASMNLDQIGPMLKGKCKWGGRNRQQWGRLLLFYTLYYILIFGLFFLIVHLFYLSTKAGSDGTRPLLHGRGIQSPGINYQPRLANAKSEHKEHINNYHTDSQTAFVYKSNSDGYKIYVDQMKDFLEKEGYANNEFDELTNNECTADNDFGFEVDKPCLFFRINKVIDWEPLGIFAEDIDAAFTEDDSNILSSEGYCSYDRFQKYCRSNEGKEEIKRIKEEIFDATAENATAYDAPFLKCIGYSGAKNVEITTYPSTGRLDWTESFKGRDSTEGRKGRSIFAARSGHHGPLKEEGYLPPVVAVQFDFTEAYNTDALFHCFMFDRNMEIETKKQASGMVKFIARVNK